MAIAKMVVLAALCLAAFLAGEYRMRISAGENITEARFSYKANCHEYVSADPSGQDAYACYGLFGIASDEQAEMDLFIVHNTNLFAKASK